MQSKGVNIGPTGRKRGRGHGGLRREAEVAAPKLVCATPYKALHNPIN